MIKKNLSFYKAGSNVSYSSVLTLSVFFYFLPWDDASKKVLTGNLSLDNRLQHPE